MYRVHRYLTVQQQLDLLHALHPAQPHEQRYLAAALQLYRSRSSDGTLSCEELSDALSSWAEPPRPASPGDWRAVRSS
jgi:hypothetical protein